MSGEVFDEEDIENPPNECDTCGLSFVVVASNDYYISQGDSFINYCPRCGELVVEESSWP